MAFQIKDFRSILASMVNWVRGSGVGVTDFSVGSVERSLLEAPAAELDQLYQEMYHAVQEAIPVATFRSFNFSRLPAVRASGLVTFSADAPASADIPIPAGTSIKSGSTSVVYETVQNATLPAGQTSVDVLVVATVPGRRGNAAAGTITELQSPVPGIASVTNAATLVNGRDVETDEERKVRFQGYISTLAKGVVEAIRYGATTAYLEDANGLITERVVHSEVDEPYKTNPAGPIALVRVYIHNGVGSTSADLVSHVQKVLEGYRNPDGTPVVGWKAAGVVVEVSAATEVSLNVTAELTLTADAVAADVISQCETAVTDYLTGLGIGKQAQRNEIIRLIKSVPGVFNLSLSAPSADSNIAADEKIMPGTIAITEAS